MFLVLKGNVEEILKQILQKIYYPVKALVVMPDHIHILVDVPQIVAQYGVVRTLKSINAIELFKVFPQLIQFYIRCSVSWSRGYSVSTVTKYIKEQKNDK